MREGMRVLPDHTWESAPGFDVLVYPGGIGTRRELADPAYGDWYAAWWAHAERHFIDRETGSWRHELDATNQPAATVWAGKPDVYHAYQAALLPSLPPAGEQAARTSTPMRARTNRLKVKVLILTILAHSTATHRHRGCPTRQVCCKISV